MGKRWFCRFCKDMISYTDPWAVSPANISSEQRSLRKEYEAVIPVNAM